MSSTVEVQKTLDVVLDLVKKELGKERIRMLDLPCGDFVWMKHFLKTRTDIEYTGIDIAGLLTENHQRTYSTETSWHFKQNDIVKNSLPMKFDLIFSRQMTQHLETRDTMNVLEHFSQSGQYLLITNYPDVKSNTPLIKTKWRFRPQNLNISPFHLADPVCEDTEDGCINALHRLSLRQWL